ncbi:slipin family protein [Labrys wisconsinensis]|uniref:Regulator of protease activity HflC (Stomatin/prohibitin superfamily) n=1 Tax=Labrys wisconsinensis TaxID=425677 RepID=A0ABU0J6K7_9HYPH|nr:slipin family protein [Labrys wisconsinensis]MDQ0468914.1 regulator of protease activity HflC (stomatin/prohibitin superfamily) [Labrys wisconsinensis]
MSWLAPWKTTVVKDNERALMSRNGRFERMLGPGRHRMLDPSGAVTVEVLPVVRAEFPSDRHSVLAQVAPDLAASLFDGQPVHFVAANSTRVFWKAITRVEAVRIDAGASLRATPAQLKLLDLSRSPLVTSGVVEQHEVGLLFVDGVLTETLAPGRHAFWAVNRTVALRKLDLRPQLVEVTAQEILTRDKVALRVTLSAFYRITDPARAVAGSTDVATALYRLVQFAVREAIATRSLDDILGGRDSIDAQLRASIAARTGDLGIVVTELGIKDVILPGEVRELINKVVEAERTARANLIRRQEETAATRSLLNTVKVMEDNPLLLRLKELEALEKLVEKVGRIDLHASDGQGLDAMLKGLFRLEPAKG